MPASITTQFSARPEKTNKTCTIKPSTNFKEESWRKVSFLKLIPKFPNFP